MRKPAVLLIAFEMPPARSAGVQRPYRFAEYLLELGWEVQILTASSDVYQRFDHELAVPPALASRMHRSFAADATKTFSLWGRSPDFVTVPDRYWRWYFSAVRDGRKLLAAQPFDLIWSTYPVLTAHLIGRKLSQISGLPLVSDFRDPLQCHYNPAYRHYNFILKALEHQVIRQSSAVVTTSQEAASLYRQLYPQQAADKFHVIENGFVPLDLPTASQPEKFTLLYSGAIYANGRDINSLFAALSNLKQQGMIHAGNFTLVFRGIPSGDRFAAELKRYQVADLIQFLSAVPFTQAQAEMMQCSANLLIQDEIFKYQIPGKIYDYIQSGKPLLAICPPLSATANVCKQLPNCLQVWQQPELEQAIVQLMQGDVAPALPATEIARYSRQQRTEQLAQLFSQLLAAHH